MNILNRFVAITFFLLVLAMAAGTVGIASGLLAVSAVDKLYAYPPLHQALSDLTHLGSLKAQTISVAAAAFVGILMLCLLVWEMIPARPERTVTLKQDQEGEVTIGFNTLRKVAERASLDVARVNTTRCRVEMRKEALRVQCRATADPFTDATLVGQQVEAAIHAQLRQTLGKPIDHVAVRIELEKPGTPVRVR